MRRFLFFGILPIFFTISCVPCRQVKIESYPPGAAISILSSSGFEHREIPPPESWSFLGYTPFTVSACRLDSEIKANWLDLELVFYEYHGSKRIRFDLEEEIVTEE